MKFGAFFRGRDRGRDRKKCAKFHNSDDAREGGLNNQESIPLRGYCWSILNNYPKSIRADARPAPTIFSIPIPIPIAIPMPAGGVQLLNKLKSANHKKTVPTASPKA